MIKYIFALLFCTHSILAQSPNISFQLAKGNIKGDVYKIQQFYGGEISLYHWVNLRGGFLYLRSPINMVFGFHHESLEIYNFKTRNWIDIKIMPTNRYFTDFRQRLSVAHLIGVEIILKQEEIFLGVGPEYSIGEFIGKNKLGFGISMRTKFKNKKEKTPLTEF